MKMNMRIFPLTLFSFLQLDMTSTMEQDFLTWMNQLISGLIQIFNSFVEGLASLVLFTLSSIIGGVLGFVGVPFTSWSQYVANNGGWFIPVLFVGILGLAFLLAEAINIIYGFEKDITSGESDVYSEEQHVAEEEAE
ncbi:MAG: hypothetical protein ACP5L4_07170 [Thermoplasmata archaeon]